MPPSIAQYNADHQAFVDYTNRSAADRNALIQGQNAKQDSLFTDYKTQIASQEKIPDMFKRISGELGIPDLSAAVQGYKNEAYRVQGLLDRLDSDVTSRTQGTLTSEGARNAIIAKDGSTLRTQLGTIGNGMAPFADLLSSAQGTLSATMPLYVQQQDKELDPIKLQINTISDRFAREISGFDKNAESQLAVLMDQLARDRALSDREWQQAADLAKQQAEYDLQLRNAKATAAASGGGGGGYGGGGGGGGGGAPAGPSPQVKQAAANDVISVLRNNNAGQLVRYWNAISASARYGNQTDQLKVQAMQSLVPGLFSGGALRTDYLAKLSAQGIRWYQ